MKKLFFIALLILFASQSFAGQLPADWQGHVQGIAVTESDLGEYKGQSSKEGGEFFWYSKTVHTRDGGVLKCSYAVLAEPPFYVGDAFSICDTAY